MHGEAKAGEAVWCAGADFLIWVDIKELGGGDANLSGGVCQIAERIYKHLTSPVYELSYPVGSSPCARRQVRQLQIP